MDIQTELSSLSHWVYCWFISLIISWFLSFIWMWQFSLCCLLFVIPFIFFIRWWYKNRVHCSLNHVLKPFLHGFVNITLLSIIAQFIGLLIISILFIVTYIASYTIGYLLYLLIAITYYVCIEEILKLYFSLKSRDSVEDPINQITKSHTITSTATGLGYSMCEGIVWCGFAAFELNKDDKKDNDSYSLFGWLFLITLIIAIIGMPMHLITGYVMGCKITQRDIEYSQENEEVNNDNNRLPFKSYINVTYYSIFVRSAYLFFLFIGFLVLQFSFGGVIIALFGIIFDYILLIKHTKQIESILPFDYLQRAGQLSIFGYNVLSDRPQNENNDDNHIYDYNDNDNDNQLVQITAVSLDNYSPNLDEPMIIGSNNKNNNNDQDNDDNILDKYDNDEISSSEHDTHSVR